MSNIIYYFTGTGNSLKVARDIAENLGDTELIQICKNNMDKDYNFKSDRVGFVFPVYSAGMPLMVRKFMEKLNIEKSVYVFAVATYGAMAGISIKQAEETLNNKGIRLSAAFGIPMPGNYQVLYAPYSIEKQNKSFKKEEEDIIHVAEKIRNNEVVNLKAPGKNMPGFLAKVMHKSFKPYDKDKGFWTNESCNGCGTCERVCPANNIKLVDGKPQWKHRCEQCVACLQWCPKQSIQYKKVTIKRGRYQHPEIKLKDLLNR